MTDKGKTRIHYLYKIPILCGVALIRLNGHLYEYRELGAIKSDTPHDKLLEQLLALLSSLDTDKGEEEGKGLSLFTCGRPSREFITD
jgi:hypothetical protein